MIHGHRFPKIKQFKNFGLPKIKNRFIIIAIASKTAQLFNLTNEFHKCLYNRKKERNGNNESVRQK